MLDMRKIGVYISGLRKQKDITQLELADLLNISHQAVSKWERGESMPDIVMLPKLSEVFGRSIDNILSGGESSGNTSSKEASIVTELINRKTDSVVEMINKREVNLQDVAEVAPILKPSMISEIVKGLNAISIEHISALAPFLDQSDLEKLIQQVEIGNISGDILEELAPFVRRETLDKLVDKVVEGTLDKDIIISIAPFISRHSLDKLVEELSNDKLDPEILGELAPFVSGEALDRLVDRVVTGEIEVETILDIAPFLKQESLQKLIKGAAGQLDGDILAELAPFLSKSAMSEMINSIIASASK